jgi:hypothetical protein
MWIKAITFMKDKFKASCFFNKRKYKEEIDDEIMLEIFSEIEQSHWDSLKVNI